MATPAKLPTPLDGFNDCRAQTLDLINRIDDRLRGGESISLADVRELARKVKALSLR